MPSVLTKRCREIYPSWRIPSVVFVLAVLLQFTFPLASKFLRKIEGMPKISTLVLSTLEKLMSYDHNIRENLWEVLRECDVDASSLLSSNVFLRTSVCPYQRR